MSEISAPPESGLDLDEIEKYVQHGKRLGLNDGPWVERLLAEVRTLRAQLATAREDEWERCAKVAARHPSQPRKSFKPSLHHTDDDVVRIREEIRIEERGEKIASEIIAAAIRALRNREAAG